MRDPVVADANGRVNLIGEHTDYHEGYVLPTLIPQKTTVRLRVRDDRLVRVETATLADRVEYALGDERRQHHWSDYVMGVTSMLAGRNMPINGFDAEITSTVPVGAGVSSSAALEIALLRALRTAMRLPLDDVELAMVGRQAETDFVGAPVGIMDQMACSLCNSDEALFLDTRTLATERLRLPAAMRLFVIDSGIAHAHASGGYLVRRRESVEAAAALGLKYLRDATMDDLGRLAHLPTLLERRARHVISENTRVLAAVEALQAGDAARLGMLFNASHASMRDDYEISTPEIDCLVGLGQARSDVFGARMTGGGFGGAVVFVAHSQANDDAARDICRDYEAATGEHPEILVPAQLRYSSWTAGPS